MPKIKKIKKVSSKIKEVKPHKNKSKLEEEIKQAQAQKEIDNFVEVVSTANKNITPTIHSNESPQITRINQSASSQKQQTEEEILHPRVSYEQARARQTYSTSGNAGARIRERNVYNPSIRPTLPNAPANPTTQAAELSDRSLSRQQFIGQENVGAAQEDLSSQEDRKREYGAHEGG